MFKFIVFCFAEDGRGSVSGEPSGDISRPRRKVGVNSQCTRQICSRQLSKFLLLFFRENKAPYFMHIVCMQPNFLRKK